MLIAQITTSSANSRHLAIVKEAAENVFSVGPFRSVWYLR